MRRTSKLMSKEARDGYLFASPWIIGFIMFYLGPILATFFLSFTEYKIPLTPKWIGLENYYSLFVKDVQFKISLYNTAYYTVFVVPLSICGSLAMAMLMNKNLRGIAVYRTAVYLPAVTSGVAVALLWMWLLDPNIGIINYILGRLGLPQPLWLQSEKWAKPALIIMQLYYIGGNTMVVFLSGLQGVPQSLYEAAEIDGANWWYKFRHVTIPMISPIILFNLIMAVINSFQVFTQAFVMTQGGPNNSTMFYVYYLYNVAFWWGRLGYAASLAWILFVIVFVLTVIQLKLSGRWVYYAG